MTGFLECPTLDTDGLLSDTFEVGQVSLRRQQAVLVAAGETFQKDWSCICLFYDANLDVQASNRVLLGVAL